jgi:predicted Na+-dependent transporter
MNVELLLVLLLTFIVFPAIVASILCWWAYRSGFTKGQIVSVALICFLPGGVIFAPIYIVCTKYDLSLAVWIGGMFVAAFILPIIGPIIWLLILFRRVREEKTVASQGTFTTSIDPETGIHYHEYVPPADSQGVGTPPSEWR